MVACTKKGLYTHYYQMNSDRRLTRNKFALRWLHTMHIMSIHNIYHDLLWFQQWKIDKSGKIINKAEMLCFDGQLDILDCFNMESGTWSYHSEDNVYYVLKNIASLRYVLGQNWIALTHNTVLFINIIWMANCKLKLICTCSYMCCMFSS